MLTGLMAARRFAPLFWCQFFSALNDNVLKNALVVLILFQIGGEGAASLVPLAAAVFIAPSFFLSALGGQLADRYDKALIAKRLKFAEIGVAAVGIAGFALHSELILFVTLFGFGCISALFGPLKYGILPDHLKREELPAGNALVEGATFLAILLGTIIGNLAAAGGGHPFVFGSIVGGAALLCWLSARLIAPTGERAPDLAIDANVLKSTAVLLRELWADTRLWRGGLVVSWFWLVGAVALSLLPIFVKDVLGGTEAVLTVYLAVFAVGIAVGSLLASFLSAGRIVLLPTPVAAVLIGLFSLDLAWAMVWTTPFEPLAGPAEALRSGLGLHAAVDLFGMAVAGGLYIVPIFAAVQSWSPESNRARVIAAVNVLSAAFMAVSSLIFALLQKVGFSLPSLFALLGAATLVVAVAIFLTLPTNAFRDLLSIIYRAFYRLEVHGLENVDKAGPNAIIALNHVSFLDAGLALSLLDREPMFAIDSDIAKRWWVKPFLRMTRALPLDPTRPLATRTLINAVKDGETLIIFPEGRLTVTGSLMKVYDGAGLIAEKSGAMVVPVKIDGLEQTPFSRLKPSQVRRKWWPKVTVTVLEPVKLEVSPELKGKKRRQAAGAALYQVMSDLVFRTTPKDRTVWQAVVQAADTHGHGRVAVEDPVSGALTYRKLLIGARALGDKLLPLAPEGGALGVLLPTANGAVATLLALFSAGRTPAMLNFTAGAGNILSACKAAQVSTVLTSRAFVEKGKMDGLLAELGKTLRIVYLEDIRGGIGAWDKLRAFLRWNHPLAGQKPAERAAILFTSGSEGAPKGVVLSHGNMLANAAQAEARIDFGRQDKVFNVLPVFHSFGLTAGTILPLVSGVPIYLYPSPLHYRIVPELVYGSNATVLFGTDTFLAGYARAAHPYDFRSLRYVVAGAEQVKEATRRVYLEKFGLRILEGYGVTETAPVLALNTPMFNRFGTVGRILPGIEMRLEPVQGVDDGGRLFVRGPNVMMGYLKADKPGVLEPPQEGWHDTGDVVAIDAEGFVTIKGRAKRFAKIGGEMISLAAVESLAADLWPDSAVAAATAPDPRKGERIVLVTERKDASRQAFQSFAKGKGAADLMIPAEVRVFEKVPVLGSGKVDYQALAKLVTEEKEKPAEAA